MRSAALWVLWASLGSVISLSAKEPFTFDAMMRLARIGDPQLSPDGRLVAFTVQTVDMAANTKPTQIYVVPVAGGDPLRITNGGISNTRPRWTPDSKRIFYVSDRPGSGPRGISQIWSMTPEGADDRPITNIPTGADGVTVSPDGSLILFTSDVYPSCTPPNALPGADYSASCNQQNLDKDAANKMNARTYTSLLYRHWTEYQGNRRRHLLIETLNNTFKVRDLTPGNHDTPPFSLGGPEPYVFSPDSIQVTFVANTDSDLSTSTNSDLFTIPAAGGIPKRITANRGADEGPVYSPDGRYLAYRTQFRAGYESDLWRLAVLNLQTNQASTLTDSLDRWVGSYTWSSDSRRLFFTIDEHGTSPLLMVAVTGGPIRTIVQGSTSVGSVQFTPNDRIMIYTEESGSRPLEINKATSRGGTGTPMTHLNDDVIALHDLTPLERMSIDVAGGDKVESFVMKPPGFDPAKKYPVLFLIHGGPEGEWGEQWSYRWNPQVFAAAGYLVILPNPHGSNGYGQAFVDAVNGDWGGRAYADIMSTADSVAALPYVDRDRMVAAGGSYGGYMIDWILGHTNRFKALVSHAGVFDLFSEAGATDELWFPKWEFHGFPWENPAMYDKWSPSSFVSNFKTPTLVTHGEIDYRVPIGQGQELFTALQQMKVPSKLVQFPDEGHWILKPKNSEFWYKTVIEWLNEYAHP
jgi:dipeptidyl aminopeptidase/acylaminoacyl peptidase